MTTNQELAEVRLALAAISEVQHLILTELRSPQATAIPSAIRTYYSVVEVATMLKKSGYTVRQWCNLGKINAIKSVEKRGGSPLWRIAQDEIDRYLNEGLLPFDPRRNDRN